MIAGKEHRPTTTESSASSGLDRVGSRDGHSSVTLREVDYAHTDHTLREVFHSSARTATEHSPAKIRRLDPNIYLRKSQPHGTVRIKEHHDRPPDVGIGILISMPNYKAAGTIEYYGEYLGHGQSKTAFELNYPGACFHGQVLKVAKKHDIEPAVFMEASQESLTTSVLYNCKGVDADSDRVFHCWITDRTIPLDDFCRWDHAIKSRCSLAAFCCILKAALNGLYLSDCHFFNFGVQLTENATEHLVVIIDAGSRGIARDADRYTKGEFNKKCMLNFWKWCDKDCEQNHDIQKMWRNAHDIKDCYEKATRAWESSPFLTAYKESTCAIWQAMHAKDSFRRSIANTKSSYKIMELVGRFTAVGQWNAAFAVACYRASEQLCSDLFDGEGNILDELYQRIQCNGIAGSYHRRRIEDEELQNVMGFWSRLNDYRCLLQSSSEQSLTSKQASEMLESFKYNELWYDLSWDQRQSRGWRSTVATIVHKRAGWTHAAKAILKYGLPKLPTQTDDATEDINALGKFAKDMAEWLQHFASGLHAYKQSDGYQKSYQKSVQALQRKLRCASQQK